MTGHPAMDSQPGLGNPASSAGRFVLDGPSRDRQDTVGAELRDRDDPHASSLPIMPTSFQSNGLRFLYPDNWTIVERSGDAGDAGGVGVTLEFPGGGFFSVEQVTDPRDDDALLAALVESVKEGYQDAEHEPISADDFGASPLSARWGDLAAPGVEAASGGGPAAEVRFYYLDLLVIARLMVLRLGPTRYVVQTQAESRDFDRNVPVFQALLKQIRENHS